MTKKLFSLFLAMTMLFGLAACGGTEKEPSVEERYQLDLTSTEQQPMSEEKLERDVLKERKNEFFLGYTFFLDTEYGNMTYEDVKEGIGIDATYYYYDEEWPGEAFVWETSDHDTAKLIVVFRDGKLHSMGSNQLL